MQHIRAGAVIASSDWFRPNIEDRGAGHLRLADIAQSQQDGVHIWMQRSPSRARLPSDTSTGREKPCRSRHHTRLLAIGSEDHHCRLLANCR
jgi:hypothetical protein